MARSVAVEWHGRRVEAARPDRIAGLRPRLSERTVRRTEQAVAAVQRAGDRSQGVFEGAARLLLRAEGLASSAIEGIRAPAGRVAVAQATDPDDDIDVDRTAAWVADNLAVVVGVRVARAWWDLGGFARWAGAPRRAHIGPECGTGVPVKSILRSVLRGKPLKRHSSSSERAHPDRSAPAARPYRSRRGRRRAPRKRV